MIPAAAAFGFLQYIYKENQGSNKMQCQPASEDTWGMQSAGPGHTHACLLWVDIIYCARVYNYQHVEDVFGFKFSKNVIF